ncbi:MAG: FliA/WhiG family RNA polymerase sigma factor [Lachnospiraceae bacterium]|nr:FliA/WhiG family RNA polymerase sigma factor [Lachnospiraceae bacterium]
MDDNARKRLWSDYSRLKSKDLRDKLIVEYLPLVKLVAGRLNMYMGSNVEFDDLCSYGALGLIDAVDKFDPRREVKFETYASLRIRGAIIDQIRKNDWIPRTIRDRQKQIDLATSQVENMKGSQAEESEIALALGISEEELLEWRTSMQVTTLVSLNEFMDNNGGEVAADNSFGSGIATPEQYASKRELERLLDEAMEKLSEKEHAVINFYYFEELSLKEIAAILEVSESRVSQLHTKAIQKMRTIMGDQIGIFAAAI